MPWRIASSASTLTEKNRFTPHPCSICTAALEKPHCGNCGVPFMYSTTGCVVTCSRIVSWMLMAGSLWLIVPIVAELRVEGRISTRSPTWDLFLHGSGQSGDVILDEERVQRRNRQRAEQRARHQRAPVIYVTLDELGYHAHGNGLHFRR